MSTQDKYQAIIKQLICPWLGKPFRDQVSVKLKDEQLMVTFKYPVEKNHAKDLKKLVAEALKAHSLGKIEVAFNSKVPIYGTQILTTKIANVKNLLAISSGKGGVGKTTAACHLAAQLSQAGYNVGLFDADIYGPNIPIMMDTQGNEAMATDNDRFIPIQKDDIATMSLAYLVDENKPMVWRGPILSKTLLQILMQTQWPQLDFLILDLPPGTGDTQLTLAQKIPLVGAVSITTPHPMAQSDALKGIKMFAKVNVPMLGFVNNMATHICSKCGHEERTWSSNVKGPSSEIPCLGNVPFDKKYAKPIKKNKQDDCFFHIVTALIKQVIKLPEHPSGNIPTIVTE